jgi:Spy/CpxP family protein refolding chaperone
MPSPEFALQHANEIDLTTGQRASLAQGLSGLQTQLSQVTGTVQRESDALASILAPDKPDGEAAAAQFEKVLAAEAELKRLRLKLSLAARATLTAEQARKLASLQNAGGSRRTGAPADKELEAKMEHLKSVLERARQKGLDLSSMRQTWRRFNELTQEGNNAEAGRVLDEAAAGIESKLAAPNGAPR